MTSRTPRVVPAVAPASDLPDLGVLLIPAEVSGPRCGVSEATWWRMHAAKRIPAPVKLGGRTLWRAEELRRWVEAGCPDRRTWDTMRAGRGGDR